MPNYSLNRGANNAARPPKGDLTDVGSFQPLVCFCWTLRTDVKDNSELIQLSSDNLYLTKNEIHQSHLKIIMGNFYIGSNEQRYKKYTIVNKLHSGINADQIIGIIF